jgi:GH15 family glucan-1,4-alpha-glucosidase
MLFTMKRIERELSAGDLVHRYNPQGGPPMMGWEVRKGLLAPVVSVW